MQKRERQHKNKIIKWKSASPVPLLLFSCSAVPDSLRPHGLQHARLPCPSPSPRVCSNSCPLQRRQWQPTPFPSPGDLPHPRIEPVSLVSPALAGRFFTTDATWEAHSHHHSYILILFYRFSYIFKMSTE